MTDEVQEVDEEQAPEAEAATETTTDEIGEQPAAESTEINESDEPASGVDSSEEGEADESEDAAEEPSSSELDRPE
jgi:hypothetical protein